MRFTIRDLLWLMVVVGLALTWGADRWRQNVRMKALQDIAGLPAIDAFPRDWEGRLAAFQNQNRLLRYVIDSLKNELELRGHRVEIIGTKLHVSNSPSQQTQIQTNAGR